MAKIIITGTSTGIGFATAVLLAKNKQGYKNLIKLTSLGFTEGMYSKYPRIDKELIHKYHEGLIASTCCLGGLVPQLILKKSEAEAENELGKTTDAEKSLNLVRKRAGLAEVNGLVKDAMRTKILHERRMELAFEGDWWFTMIRINNGQFALDFLHSIGRVNATTKHLLLPIPQKEKDTNPNLIQNPGY